MGCAGGRRSRVGVRGGLCGMAFTPCPPKTFCGEEWRLGGGLGPRGGQATRRQGKAPTAPGPAPVPAPDVGSAGGGYGGGGGAPARWIPSARRGPAGTWPPPLAALGGAMSGVCGGSRPAAPMVSPIAPARTHGHGTVIARAVRAGGAQRGIGEGRPGLVRQRRSYWLAAAGAERRARGRRRCGREPAARSGRRGSSGPRRRSGALPTRPAAPAGWSCSCPSTRRCSCCQSRHETDPPPSGSSRRGAPPHCRFAR
eukprot:scaffold91968_cov60-Phaeocystis_antarctica.AAC.3